MARKEREGMKSVFHKEVIRAMHGNSSGVSGTSIERDQELFEYSDSRAEGSNAFAFDCERGMVYYFRLHERLFSSSSSFQRHLKH